ncbi:MAG: hypothetical protein U0237_13875 [Thermoleophilia bacterium]
MTPGAPDAEGRARGEGRRILLGLALVAVGLPLAAAATFPLLGAIVGTDNADWELALIGFAALVPGVLLVVTGIRVLAHRPRVDAPPGPG